MLSLFSTRDKRNWSKTIYILFWVGWQNNCRKNTSLGRADLFKSTSSSNVCLLENRVANLHYNMKTIMASIVNITINVDNGRSETERNHGFYPLKVIIRFVVLFPCGKGAGHLRDTLDGCKKSVRNDAIICRIFDKKSLGRGDWRWHGCTRERINKAWRWRITLKNLDLIKPIFGWECFEGNGNVSVGG